MKIFTFNDNHERTNFKIPQPEEIDVLIHCGDASNDIIRSLNWFSKFPHEKKIFIPGNHETYTKLINNNLELSNDRSEILWDEERNLSKELDIIFLNNDSYILNDNLVIHGATLYTDYKLNKTQKFSMKIANDHLNDHLLNNSFKAEDILKIHKTSKNYIEKALLDFKSFKQVVVTHHAPFKECEDPYYFGDPLNAAFISDLKFKVYPDIWFYGHTHKNKDLMKNNTRLINNCVGYEYENCNYNPNLIVEI